MTRSVDLHVRIAREDDVPALCRMRLALQAHMQRGNASLAEMSDTRKGDLAAEYRSRLLAEDDRVLVATSGPDAVVGGMAIGSVSLRADLVPSLWGRIDDVWVDESLRRRGVSRMMFVELLEFFRERRASSVVLDYSVGNPEAEGAWRSFGFEPILTTAVADTERLLSAALSRTPHGSDS